MSTSDEEAARLRKQETQLLLVGGAASLIATGWFLIPQHQKRLWGMQVAETVRRLLDRGAHHAGYQAMALELDSGRTDFYSLPYVLSVARDRARSVYDQLRSVS